VGLDKSWACSDISGHQWSQPTRAGVAAGVADVGAVCGQRNIGVKQSLIRGLPRASFAPLYANLQAVVEAANEKFWRFKTVGAVSDSLQIATYGASAAFCNILQHLKTLAFPIQARRKCSRYLQTHPWCLGCCAAGSSPTVPGPPGRGGRGRDVRLAR
jgi:hypothetical protein